MSASLSSRLSGVKLVMRDLPPRRGVSAMLAMVPGIPSATHRVPAGWAGLPAPCCESPAPLGLAEPVGAGVDHVGCEVHAVGRAGAQPPARVEGGTARAAAVGDPRAHPAPAR